MIDFLRLFVAFSTTYRAYAWLGVSSLACAAGASWARATALMVAVALGGCAVLPKPVERPVSYARTDIAGTTLAKMAAGSTGSGQHELSGFRLLPDGEEAYQARLVLIRMAEKALDVQYFLIANDRTGRDFLGALGNAAARGVHVRLLVDDLYATGEDELLAAMASLPNVEVRMFNPLPVRGSSVGARIALSFHQLSRINHRMHNKLLVADESFTIAGGRNIADEYFDRAGASTNFIDMDVLASGPIVADLEQAFLGFWNSEHSYPLQALLTLRSRESVAGPIDASLTGASPTSAASRLALGGMTFAPASLLSDGPGKVEGGEGAVANGHLALLEAAHSEVIVSSPYFVPGERARAVLQGDLAREVRICILTNSLGTTDEPVVHIGYARYRAALIAAGASLRELMPERQADKAVPLSIGGLSGSAGRLHGKLAVVDEETVFVGSMNMDRRSDRANTEYGIVIASPVLARAVKAFLEQQIDQRSYNVQLTQATGALRWVAGQDGVQTSQTVEPAGESRHGLGTHFLARLVGEDML
jgi:putative cardiolipin synthase